MSKSNIQFGYSSRKRYDDGACEERLSEITSPGSYRLSPDQIYNCNNCLSTFGPRGGNGVSTLRKVGYAESQDLVDVESDLSNRNMKYSGTKRGGANIKDMHSQKYIHRRLCNNELNPEYTRMSHPSSEYRGMSVNRFYNLQKDPQENIFWDDASNTSLEARDNFVFTAPELWEDKSHPPNTSRQYKPCNATCRIDKKTCPGAWMSPPPSR